MSSYYNITDYDEKRHWHLLKSRDHHWEDESSSSSSHSCDDESSSSSSSSSHSCHDESSSSSSSSRDWDHHKDHHKEHEGCVEEVLKAILHAQKKVKKHKGCDTSCNESIKELLGKKKEVKKNTIPFILFCGDCEPFKATGVTTFSCHSQKEKFACITSFIFKIKKVKDGCAVIELLAIKPDKCDNGKKCHCKGDCVCCQLNNKDVDDLVRTGICITVDLSCFCAITCLPPVCL